MNPKTLPYYGGKSEWSGTGTGRWVASMLPSETKVCYVEPFAGMLGVLMQRRPSQLEIVNDLDKRVHTFWTVVRDRNSELAERLRRTPYSRVEFDLCRRFESDDPVEIARCVAVVLTQGLMSGTASRNWRRCFSIRRNVPPSRIDVAARIEGLLDRLRPVQLECVDACELLERVAPDPDTVVYCDPPYLTADTNAYSERTLDVDRFLAALKLCKGRCAVSGYGDEWDALGWQRHEHVTTSSARARTSGGHQRSSRTEVLWTNYSPPGVNRGLFD